MESNKMNRPEKRSYRKLILVLAIIIVIAVVWYFLTISRINSALMSDVNTQKREVNLVSDSLKQCQSTNRDYKKQFDKKVELFNSRIRDLESQIKTLQYQKDKLTAELHGKDDELQEKAQAMNAAEEKLTECETENSKHITPDKCLEQQNNAVDKALVAISTGIEKHLGHEVFKSLVSKNAFGSYKLPDVPPQEAPVVPPNAPVASGNAPIVLKKKAEEQSNLIVNKIANKTKIIGNDRIIKPDDKGTVQEAKKAVINPESLLQQSNPKESEKKLKPPASNNLGDDGVHHPETQFIDAIHNHQPDNKNKLDPEENLKYPENADKQDDEKFPPPPPNPDEDEMEKKFNDFDNPDTDVKSKRRGSWIGVKNQDHQGLKETFLDLDHSIGDTDNSPIKRG